MTREPVGILAAIGGVVTWVLHTYVPDMPAEVVSAIGVLVAAVARQWVVPHDRHVREVEAHRAEASVAKGRAERNMTIGVVLALLLCGGATAEAQGIRDTLEEIGRGVAAGAAREGLDALGEQVDRLDGGRGAEDTPELQRRPAASPPPAPTTPSAQPLRTIDWILIGVAVVGLGGVVALLLRGSGGPTSIVETAVTARQATRVLTLAALFGATFAGVVWVEHLESIHVGRAAVLNQVHQALGVLEAFLGSSLIIVAVYDVLLLRFFTLAELATGKAGPGREEVSLIGKMSPTTRVACLHGTYALWVALVLVYGFGVGL